jgi:acyl carrier protein
MDEAVAAYVQRREDIVQRVVRLLGDRLEVQRELDEVDPDTPLFGLGLALDSIDAVELLVSVEQEFGVALVEERALRAMRTVGTLTDAILEAGA